MSVTFPTSNSVYLPAASPSLRSRNSSLFWTSTLMFTCRNCCSCPYLRIFWLCDRLRQNLWGWRNSSFFTFILCSVVILFSEDLAFSCAALSKTVINLANMIEWMAVAIGNIILPIFILLIFFSLFSVCHTSLINIYYNLKIY